MPKFSLSSLKVSAEYSLSSAEYRATLDLNWRSFRDTSQAIFDNFLSLATAKLLLDLQVEQFFINLHHCAENWRRYILTSEHHYNRKIPLFHDAPLYAALITRDQHLLTELSNTLDPAFKKGHEYEDTFYICWLHLTLALNGFAFDEKIAALLNALENCQVDSGDTDMFKALLGQNGLKESDFWEAFEIALYEYDQYVEKRISSFSLDITKFTVHRFIWLKGISLLQIALAKGFTLPSKNIMYCPDEVLASPPQVYPAVPELIELS